MCRSWWVDAAALLRDERGNMATEFALVIPFIVLLMIGFVDWGMTARERSTLDAAARAGLQVLLQNPANIAAAATMAAAVAPDAEISASLACICVDGSDVDCTGSCPINSPRQIVAVTATVAYSLLLPWPLFDDSIELVAVAKGRVQ
jgi:Flp pilus assembly protein TadG